ncbi:MAG TPA: hypothetical protein PLG89_01930 [Arenimonas sp.]|nr:hypothetical protein [Arenimonas sp.]
MKPMLPHLCVALLLAAPALVPATSRVAEPAAHHASHAGHAPGKLPADSGAPAVRWQADEPLARGMKRLRAATQALSHGAHGHLSAEQVKAIAAELDAAVQDMIAQCRLEPEPDAALHPLLARVLQASARLASGKFDAKAMEDLEAVLARYPVLFDDVAWSADQIDSA